MSSTWSSAEIARTPRTATGVALLLLGVAALYWPDTWALVRYWLDHDVNAQTGVLIALLSGFLLFRARGQLERIATGPVSLAGLPLIACAAASLICWRAGILTLQLIFLPAILWLSLLSVFGWATARVAAFAIGFLYFALPGWGLLGPTLQRLTAWAVGVVGPVIGLPVTMAGTTIFLPAGISFAVEPNCSGVDFLAAGLAIATLHGELERASFPRRVRLIGAMILVAIVSNWIRVLLIVEIGYRSRMYSALATRDHLALGWVVFACALLLFVWVAGRTGAAAPDAAGIGQSHGEAVVRATVQREHAPWWRYGGVATALFAVPVLVYGSLLAVDARTGAAGAALELPAARTPWTGPMGSTDSVWQPRFAGAHVKRARYQGTEGRAVEVVAIGFPRQARGAQILDEGNSLLGNGGLETERVTLVHDAGIPHGEVIAIDPSGRRSVIWSVIDIGGRLFGEPVASQLWYGARSLTGVPYSALFALRAECGSSCDPARAALADFLRANGSALFASLPAARPGV